MTNLKSLKRALFSTVLSIALCVCMLVGTTYAWFTDTATSKGNTITTGTLDVDLFVHDENGRTELDADDATTPDAPVFGADILWEPNMTQVRYFSIKNNGTLALKYKVVIEVTVHNATNYDLTDVMYYQVTPGATYDGAPVTAWDYNNEHSIQAGLNGDVENVRLLPNAENFFAVSIHMDEEADNNYQNSKITFDIKVLAGQEAYESDDFSDKYDEFAGYPGTGYSAPLQAGQSALSVVVSNDERKVGSAVVPAGALADPTQGVQVDFAESDYNHNVTVQAGSETENVDITVTNIKEGNTEPVKLQYRLDAGKDPSTVKVWHKGVELTNVTYNPLTGYVTFEVTEFSPFLFAIDKDSVYVPPVVDTEDENKYPEASVVKSPEYVNTTLPWGSYGTWSPTEGLDSELEAAYTFSCKETLDEAKANEYANWYCDFYVKLDCDLGENEIFLGGNYGSFGWVGFHNGELTLDANTEIALLGSVTSNPWTYLDVVQNVGTFICGVGDVDDALNGSTFTVTLRLTNPEDETEYVDIAVINYTFGEAFVAD